MHQPRPGLDTKVASSFDQSQGSHRFIPSFGSPWEPSVKVQLYGCWTYLRTIAGYTASDWLARFMTSHFLFLPGAFPFSAVDLGRRGWDGLGLAEILSRRGFHAGRGSVFKKGVLPAFSVSIYTLYAEIALRKYRPRSFRPVTRSDPPLLRPQCCHALYLSGTLNPRRKEIADSWSISQKCIKYPRKESSSSSSLAVSLSSSSATDFTRWHTVPTTTHIPVHHRNRHRTCESCGCGI